VKLGQRIAIYTLDCIRRRSPCAPARLWLLLLGITSWMIYPLVLLRGLGYSRGVIRRRQLSIPVISIGNISLGGTGKTPMVERIARVFSNEGRRVVILTRGYKGSAQEKTLVVSRGARVLAGPREAGDEAFMLARNLTSVGVIVDKDRFRSGKVAMKDLGAQALILDDGFQHLALQRDLDVVLIDAAEPFGYGRLFPRGLLREPLKGLSRADIMVIVQGAESCDLERLRGTLRRYNRQAPIFVGRRRPLCLVALPGESEQKLEGIRGQRCVAFCGIASPHAFLSLLASLGAEVIRSFSFPDHHPYTPEELHQIVEGAKAAGAQLILTTEKDAVRLPVDLLSLPLVLSYLRMEIQLSEEEAFFSLLKKRAGLS